MKKIIAALAACSTLAACASGSQTIRPSYVSTLPYQGLSCGQLQQEAQAVSARAAEASGVQDQKATGDAIATGVAIVVFWPALFFIHGDGASAAEVARLKGEMQAIEDSARRRGGCGIKFQQAAKPAPKAKNYP